MVDESRAQGEDGVRAKPGGPRTSVVIAAYDAAHCLPETLDSILAQTVRPDEVIVVDDGSRDGTGDVARDHPVRPTVIHQPNAGMCAARNTAVEALTGELVFVLDSDDLWHPRYVERMTGMMVAHPAAACGFARYRAWQHPVETPAPWEDEVDDAVRIHDFAAYLGLGRRGLPVLPSFHVTWRDNLHRLGKRPYRESQVQGEAAFMFPLLAVGRPVVEHVGPLGRYRMHADAATGDEMGAARDIERCMDDLLEASNGRLGLDLTIQAPARRAIERHAADWYRRCGRRLGGGGDRPAARRQLRKAARLGDRTAAAMLVLGFIPGMGGRVWTQRWRPDAVRRDAGVRA